MGGRQLTAKRTKVLMVCAHEPNLDPRIRWEAEAAGRRFDVTVLGFSREDGSCLEFEVSGSHRTIRLHRSDFGISAYFWRFKDLFPKQILFCLAAVIVLVSPLIVVSEILIRLAIKGLRLLSWPLPYPLLSIALLKRVLRRSRISWRPDRVDAIRYILRSQFSPAAVLFGEFIDGMPQKPDVIHCNDLDTLLVGARARRKYRCRVIYDAHEFWPVADSLCSWIDTKFFSMLERRLLRHVDAVVTVNPMLADAIRDAYGLKRVYSVPNVEPWVEHRAALVAHSPMNELAAGRVKFLFQGRFTLARGIDEVVRAWGQVDGGAAALFLRGPDNIWRQRTMELAAQRGVLGKSVYFLDAVTEHELVAAASEADVGIIPYLPIAMNERLACPNKLSQYLHAGLMVVTNNLPYVKFVLDEAEAGLSYDSSDLGTLVETIDRIVSHPELLRRSQENARRFAREHFNWQVHGKTFLQLYAGELEGEPKRAGGLTDSQIDYDAVPADAHPDMPQ